NFVAQVTDFPNTRIFSRFNSISLGFLLWTVVLLRKEQDILAAVLFCLALNYKQMALYYSLPIFFFLLSRCLNEKKIVWMVGKFVALAMTVLFTFGLLWLPYLSNVDSLL